MSERTKGKAFTTRGLRRHESRQATARTLSTSDHVASYRYAWMGGRRWPVRGGSRLWAIVLAGHPDAWAAGRSGSATPVDSRILLESTLRRVTLTIPLERTVVVADQFHAAHLEDSLGESLGLTLLRRPENRGTACATLLPAHWVSWRDPDATVALRWTWHSNTRSLRSLPRQ